MVALVVLVDVPPVPVVMVRLEVTRAAFGVKTLVT